MSGLANAAAIAMLAISTGVVGACIVGMYRAPDVFGRLHFTGAVSLLGPAGLALALGLAGESPSTVLRAWLVAAALLGSGAIATHATARAELLRRRYGDEDEGDEGR